jgi:predicted RNA-binding Zn-ribbon protein involved in translation (DUF1610 family)
MSARWSESRTPFAILCPDCGQVFLTEDEYDRQMSAPDSRWQCPKCLAKPVDWDDDNYESAWDGL